MKRYLGFELHPILFNPFVDIQVAINFSMYMGLILLTFGCLISIVNDIHERKYLEILVEPDGIPGIWILWGGYYLLTKHGLQIFSIFADPYILITSVVPFLVIWFGEWKFTKLPFAMALIEAVDNFLRYIINSISHIRIVIMAIMHAALSLVMVIGMDNMPQTFIGGIGTVIIFLTGNAIILFVETFISFIQTLRLHYYELFSKFYKGEGRFFSPFKVIRGYTYIKET